MDHRFKIIQTEMLCAVSRFDYINVVHLKWFKGQKIYVEEISIIT